jgi:hypothetical protein
LFYYFLFFALSPSGARRTKLEVLRFRVRLARDLKALPTTSHGHAAQLLEAVGAQVGGWLKSQRRGEPT